MRRIYFVPVAAMTLALVTFLAAASEHADGQAAPIFGIKIFAGYRDWKLISVAHEAGNLNDIRAVLGNDIAIKSYREGRQSFPDGAVIARLSWNYVPSEENNKVFGRDQSFVAGSRRIGTCSSWSKTQRNTLHPEAGGTLNLIRTASPPTKRSMELVIPATYQ